MRLLKPHSYSQLYLPLPIKIRRIHIERLPERRGVGLGAGKKVERRQRVSAAGLKVIAGRFKLGDVLMVE
jgi:hypothetical protein